MAASAAPKVQAKKPDLEQAKTPELSQLSAAKLGETELAGLLKKSVSALKNTDYRGIFIIEDGTGASLTVFEVVHGTFSGEKFEHIAIVDPTRQIGAESLRLNGDIHCRNTCFSYAEGSIIDVEAVKDNYRILDMGVEIKANRLTRRIALQPKLADRYIHELWLDADTGLVLAKRAVDFKTGKIMERLAFSSIELGPQTIDKAAFFKRGSLQNQTVQAASNRPQERLLVKGFKVAEKLPPKGYRLVKNKSEKNTISVWFSDGLSEFSVLIEKGVVSSGAVKHYGCTLAIRRGFKDEGVTVTVVGDIPLSTATKVIEGAVSAVSAGEL